ncbi:MAG TPA: hypothetical protein VGM49_05255 [Candidatus Limnocylindrales bacterium]|jgi:hypothetical protein
MGGSMSGNASFDRFAGWLSVLAGIGGLGYAIAFVVLKDAGLSALFLMLGPLFAIGGLVAVFERVRGIDAGLALVALVVAAFGSLASSSHGAFDLANVLHPQVSTVLNPTSSAPDLPNAVDPRGYASFALNGLALILIGWLARRTSELPGWVGPLAMALGVVLVVTWLGRLIVLDATSLLVLGPALVAGVLSPAFFLLLGAWLLGWRRSAG